MPEVPDVSISHSVARSVFEGGTAVSGRPALIDQRDGLVRPLLGTVGDDSVDLGILDQRAQIVGIEIGRTQQHAPRDPVDLDHRESGDQLARDTEAAPSVPTAR